MIISRDIGQNTIFYGGHFEIQNGGRRRGRKKWNQIFLIQHPQIENVSPKKNQFWHDYRTGLHSSLY